jgi:hypothetical protein
VLSRELPESPLRPSCAGCRNKMRLESIDPHPDYGRAFELHTFHCDACGRTQTYTLRRKPPPIRSAMEMMPHPPARRLP